ncbi:MAG: transcription termination/antitermination protein NusG [Candidatus Calescibacterium sp.]|nr:transcription termination/antitermination protein NusG [Candidatus Calescibacterium sp.]MCX7971965.1 transcription termination/antitermination protein NusG [bacterium]MDW8195449.1 transcription termination/antitermination protein NusG [Candidatus Calescibacterium sp.]
MEEKREEIEITDSEDKLKSHPDAEWYIVHTLSGMEDEVKNTIEVKARNLGLDKKIFRLIVPFEREIKVKAGKQKEVKRRIFPGYVFIEMILDNETWSFIKGIQGVTGFVGPQNKPTPLTYEEIKKIRPFIEGNVPTKRVEFNVGDTVRITYGPFVDSQGVIEKIYPEKGKAIVSIVIFGRETPIEIDLTECEKIG